MREKRYLDKVEMGEYFHLPFTPGYWIGKPETIPVTKIKVTHGGGMGGASYPEFVERMEFDELKPNAIITARRAIGQKMVAINTRFMVSAENYDIVHARFQNDNTHFEVGEYDVYILTEPGHEIRFV